MRSKPDDSPLAALAARRAPSDLPETVDIDVSEWYGEGATLTLRRLTVADKWMASRDRAKVVKGMRSHWPNEICVIVSTLATAHVAPAPGAPGPIPFYLGLADAADDGLLWHLQEQYLSFSEAGAKIEPITDSEADKVLLYCCLTYLHRHPSELTDLDASAVDDLLATYKRDLEEKAALLKRLGPLAAMLGLGGK